MRYTRLGFLLAACVLALASCLPKGQREHEIIHAKLGPHDLYIPKDYVKFQHTSIGNESALLQAWYPGSAIVPGDSSIELWKQGLWWKNIRILIDYYENPAGVSKLADARIKSLKAYEDFGNEFGLVHHRQPDGFIQDHEDIWLEEVNNETVSFIICSESLIEKDFPQCTHYIQVPEKLWLKVSYDRRLLPDWRLIKNNVEAMFKSFETSESAREFVRLRMNELDNKKQEAK